MLENFILIENDDISIKIKYFKEGIEEQCENIDIKNLKIVPYIVVKLVKKISVNNELHSINN